MGTSDEAARASRQTDGRTSSFRVDLERGLFEDPEALGRRPAGRRWKEEPPKSSAGRSAARAHPTASTERWTVTPTPQRGEEALSGRNANAPASPLESMKAATSAGTAAAARPPPPADEGSGCFLPTPKLGSTTSSRATETAGRCCFLEAFDVLPPPPPAFSEAFPVVINPGRSASPAATPAAAVVVVVVVVVVADGALLFFLVLVLVEEGPARALTCPTRAAAFAGAAAAAVTPLPAALAKIESMATDPAPAGTAGFLPGGRAEAAPAAGAAAAAGAASVVVVLGPPPPPALLFCDGVGLAAAPAPVAVVVDGVDRADLAVLAAAEGALGIAGAEGG
jgi:hypothetical protein